MIKDLWNLIQGRISYSHLFEYYKKQSFTKKYCMSNYSNFFFDKLKIIIIIIIILLITSIQLDICQKQKLLLLNMIKQHEFQKNIFLFLFIEVVRLKIIF